MQSSDVSGGDSSIESIINGSSLQIKFEWEKEANSTTAGWQVPDDERVRIIIRDQRANGFISVYETRSN